MRCLQLRHQDPHSPAADLQTYTGLEQGVAVSADQHIHFRHIVEVHNRGPGDAAEHGVIQAAQ